MKRLLLILGGACLLAVPAHAAQAPAAAPTFNKDIAPILYANCIACHREGEIAPMSLMTYQEARPWAKGIKTKVTNREMPPWFADPRYGKFRNARGLTQEQINTIVKWVDAGAPQGTGAAPTPPAVVENSVAGTLVGFMTRPPDAIVFAPYEFDIPPAGDFTGLDLWSKHDFQEDKYIQAAEIRPSNRGVTHHSQVGAQPLPKGTVRLGNGPAWRGGPIVAATPVHEDGTPLENNELAPEEASANTEGFNFATRLLHYAPGSGTIRYGDGIVKTIHRDDYLSWNIHYNATGRPEKDRHQVRLWFTTEKPKMFLKSATANQVNIYEGKEMLGKRTPRPNIPAYAEDYRVASLFTIPYEATLNSLWPHMHLRGKDMTFSVTYPDGKEEILLSVPRYNFNWQTIYAFDQPKVLPAGSILRAVAHFDNSAKNKFNPAPDQELAWGGQSWHEMYFPYFDLAISPEVDKVRDNRGDCDNSSRTGCLVEEGGRRTETDRLR